MTPSISAALFLIGSYLLGSVPFGFLIAKAWKGVDVRTLGSGNIGATNVGRVCGPKVFAVVFFLDVLKGFVPPALSRQMGLSASWQIAAALLSIVGHIYSIWLGFKGGKGVATGLGAFLGVAWQAGITAFVIFVTVLIAFGWVSLASIAACIALPTFTAVFNSGDRVRLVFATVVCMLGIYKHRSNIKRLVAGTEPKVKRFGSKPSPPDPFSQKQEVGD